MLVKDIFPLIDACEYEILQSFDDDTDTDTCTLLFQSGGNSKWDPPEELLSKEVAYLSTGFDYDFDSTIFPTLQLFVK